MPFLYHCQLGEAGASTLPVRVTVVAGQTFAAVGEGLIVGVNIFGVNRIPTFPFI